MLLVAESHQSRKGAFAGGRPKCQSVSSGFKQASSKHSSQKVWQVLVRPPRQYSCASIAFLECGTGSLLLKTWQLLEVMDVFYYPEMPGQWMACCKHTDPGLITVVVADTAGLEVHRDHAWVPANAELPSAAAMIGEEWANAYFLQAVPLPACQPCLHQVQLKGASRVSIAFEMRLSPEGREQLLRAQEVLYSDPVQKPKTNCTCFPPVSMFVGRAIKCCYKGS